MRIDIKIAQYGVRVLNLYIKNYNKKLEKRKDEEWNSHFKEDIKYKFKLNDSLFIYLFQDSVLSKFIYKGFEETELLFIRRYLNEDDIFIDIGANIGLFSLHAAQVIGKKGKVIAFEPTPVTYSRLLLNVSLNHFNEIVTCNNLGLSDKKGLLKMNISNNGYDAWNTFALPTETFFNEQIDVPVETLDNYLSDHNISISNISFIKVDVEGWEAYVIRGASNFLKNKDAPSLLVEFTEENAFAAGTNCYELYDLIKSFGYNWYTYDSIKNQLIPEHKRMHYPYNNLIAIKDIEKAQLRLLEKSPHKVKLCLNFQS